jgi:uncharacterized protein GlcG (DUF336 family)
MRVAIGCVILSAALLGAWQAHAQGVVTQKILSLNAAKVIAEAALAECRGRGFHTSVAVVDRSGTLLVVLRDEGANPATIDMAKGKAYTALVFRSRTLDFQKATADDPARAPQRNVPGILALGGGVPIIVDGEILGGVASSGSSQKDDDECARAGLAKAAELLK